MRKRSSAIFLFAAVFIAMPLFAQEGWDSDLAGVVDQYIDQRYEGDSADTDTLLNQLRAAGITNDKDLESVLRRPRATYPDSSELVGKTTVHDVECLHVDYKTRFFMYVPSDMDLTKPVSLVIVGHGGNSSMSQDRAESTAKAYLKAYQGLADQMKAVLIAPASCRGWGQIGNSLILSSVSIVQRKIRVDPDRIYITGQSMGGHLSFRSALSLPDRFGAVSPHSGGYDFVAKKTIGNLINVPGYAIWGKREPYGINTDNRTNQAWAESHSLDWKFVEKNGGHEIYQDELANVGKFFAERPRDLYRDQVYIRTGGAIKFVKTWQIKGWPEHEVFSDSKPLRWNMRHWLEIQPRPELEESLTILAKNLGDNKIEVSSQNVRNLSVFLHPNMVDLSQPVAIVVNGEELFNSKVKTDPGIMFELAREFDDRGRIFWARVNLEIKSDNEVEIEIDSE